VNLMKRLWSCPWVGTQDALPEPASHAHFPGMFRPSWPPSHLQLYLPTSPSHIDSPEEKDFNGRSLPFSSRSLRILRAGKSAVSDEVKVPP
jgi:hypothetical protein